MSDVEEKNNEMSSSLEYMLRRSGEECEAWSKLHLMAHKKFKHRETMFNLPIITITAFIGFVSGLNVNYEYIHIILGGMSLYASLLKSYFSYLKISQKSENHRIAYIQYGQIANEIRVEMALEPTIRKPSDMLIDLIRIKMKNLNEVSEIIDSSIIREYLSMLEKNNPERGRMQLFMRGKMSQQSDDHEQMHDFGRPNILKLANRFESYVDIENKIMNAPYVRRSGSSMHVNNDNPSSASDSGSTTETNATDGAVSGIMV
jgi:hypothetical protein